MHSLSLRKITLKSNVLAGVLSLVYMIIIMFFFVIHQKAEAMKIAEGVRNDLITIFYENENIADALSSKYTSSMHDNSECKIPKTKFKDDTLTWTNTSAKKDYGMLISFNSLNHSSKCIISSSMFVKEKINNSDLITKSGFRYVMVRNNKTILFLNNYTEEIDLHGSLIFNHLENFISSSPDYYKRKLYSDIKLKGAVATPIYKDSINGENTYSVISFVYDLNNTNSPVAYMIYDHSTAELNGIAKKNTSSFNGISIKIIDNVSSQELCFNDCKQDFDLLSISTSLPLSSTFHLKLSQNLLIAMLVSHFFKFSLLISIVIFILTKKITWKFLMNLDKQAYLDHLTGLYSRKIEPEINNKYLENSYISIIDCNSFKVINDTHGHNVGDRVLILVASVIKSVLRKEDISIRYGGDEFLVILNSVSRDEAYNIMNRIAKVVSSKNIITQDKKVLINISFGISKYRNSLFDSIQVADEKMYEMKKSLKNG